MSTEEVFQDIEITDSMKASSLEYALANIKRSLPDIRDGLKPSQRRILFAGYRVASDHLMKSGLVVGEALTFIPHGDQSIYNTIVRLTQEDTNIIPLFSGQGYFGSTIGSYNGFVAQRYSEVKLSDFTKEIFFGPEFKYVEMMRNYAGTTDEPVYLPAKIPYALLNGVKGVATGYSVNIPSHRLKDVINMTVQYIRNKKINFKNIHPNFKSGGIIDYGKSKPQGMYINGTGRFHTTAEYTITEGAYGRTNITIKNLPNAVDVETFIMRLKQDAKSGKYQDIVKLEDLSDGADGVHIVMGVKRGKDYKNVISTLLNANYFRKANYFTPNFIIDGKTPKRCNVTDIIHLWYKHRVKVLNDYFAGEIEYNKIKLHKYSGLSKIAGHMTRFQELLNKSKTKSSAINNIKRIFGMDDVQAEFVIDMKYQTSINKMKMMRDHISGIKRYINTMIKFTNNVDEYIIDELMELDKKYKTKRYTKIKR